MSIAEKLTTIAENEQKVKDLNDELESILYGTDTGGKSYYDLFWDNFQHNGEPMNYYYAFAHGRFTDETYKPKYDLRCADSNTGSQAMFYSSSITDIKVPIYADKSIQAAFYQCKNLKRIPKLVLSENTNISTAFYQATALEEISIEGTIGKACDMGSCSNLNKESIKGIVAVLSNENANTLTFNSQAVNKAFETSEGLADGSTSEEWLALVNSKPNWTIAI